MMNILVEEPVHFHQSTCIKEKRPPGGGLQDSFPLSINNTVCSYIFFTGGYFPGPFCRHHFFDINLRRVAQRMCPSLCSKAQGVEHSTWGFVMFSSLYIGCRGWLWFLLYPLVI